MEAYVELGLTRARVDSDHPVDLTIVSGSSEAAATNVDADAMNAFQVALRASALGSNEIIRRDIDTFIQYQAPALQLTYRVIIPKQPLPQDPLNFDQTFIDQNIGTRTHHRQRTRT